MIEWILVMVWATALDQPQQRQVIYGPGKTYQMRHQEDCVNAAEIHRTFLYQSDWPYKPYTKFVCETIKKK